jgi:hypothetical protein
MTLDNSRTIISIRIRLFVMTILLIAYIIMTYFAKVIHFPVLGMGDKTCSLILVGIYFVLAFYPMVLSYQFISYSDEGDKIVFKYFMAGIAGGKKNSVEISKATFAGYRKETEFFGLIKSVILFQQLPEGVAKYPPIYISILSAKERAKVLNSLYLHTPKDAPEAEK